MHTKFELSSFISSKDTIRASKFKNGLPDRDHAHFRIVCYPKANKMACRLHV